MVRTLSTARWLKKIELNALAGGGDAKQFFSNFSGGSPIFLGVRWGLKFFGGGCLQFFGGGVSNFSGGSPIFGGVSNWGGCLQFFWGGFSNFSGGLQFFGGGVYGQRSAGTHPTGMHSCLCL